MNGGPISIGELATNESLDRGRRSCEREREALSLIHFLRDQGQPPSVWPSVLVLVSDQTISEPVRQRALQFAREWK